MQDKLYVGRGSRNVGILELGFGHLQFKNTSLRQHFHNRISAKY
jgi:hypothetical protein